MNFKKIAKLHYYMFDITVSDQEKIKIIKQSYNLDDLYNEYNDSELYLDPVIQYFLYRIHMKLEEWNERGLIELNTNKKTK